MLPARTSIIRIGSIDETRVVRDTPRFLWTLCIVDAIIVELRCKRNWERDNCRLENWIVAIERMFAVLCDRRIAYPLVKLWVASYSFSVNVGGNAKRTTSVFVLVRGLQCQDCDDEYEKQKWSERNNRTLLDCVDAERLAEGRTLNEWHRNLCQPKN